MNSWHQNISFVINIFQSLQNLGGICKGRLLQKTKFTKWRSYTYPSNFRKKMFSQNSGQLCNGLHLCPGALKGNAMEPLLPLDFSNVDKIRQFYGAWEAFPFQKLTI